MTEWRYEVRLRGTVEAENADEACERALDEARYGDPEDDEVEVEPLSMAGPV